MDGKIFKISGYFVDPNGENEADEMVEKLRNFGGTFGKHIHVEEADIVDWTDDNPLNYEKCDLSVCEKFFSDKDSERYTFFGEVYDFFGNSRKVLGIEYVSINVVRLVCKNDIVFLLERGNAGFSLFEIDNGRMYYIGDRLQTLRDVYDRMCKEHGSLRE